MGIELGLHIKGSKEDEGIWKYGAEEDISDQEGGSSGRLEKNAYWRTPEFVIGRKAYRALEGKMKGRDLGIDVRTILSWILKKQDGRIKGHWLDSCGSG